MGGYVVQSLQVETPSTASRAAESAPILEAYTPSTAAPPMMTFTLFLVPRFFNSVIVSAMLVIVVVIRADIPRMSGFDLSTSSANAVGETSKPRSITVNPAPRRRLPKMCFPMSCRSPWTVPMTTVPLGLTPACFRCGSTTSSACFMVSPAMMSSERK